jgi:hypothetical protein
MAAPLSYLAFCRVTALSCRRQSVQISTIKHILPDNRS